MPHYLADPHIDLVSARSGIFEDVLQETLLITCRKKNRSKIATAHVLELTSLAQLKVTPVGEFDFGKGIGTVDYSRAAGQITDCSGFEMHEKQAQRLWLPGKTRPLGQDRPNLSFDDTLVGLLPLIWRSR